MTWIMSKALMEAYENSHCSPEQEAVSSEGSCSDGEQYAPLNVMPTQHPFWLRDKTMDILTHSRFSAMSASLTESRGEDVLTWCQEDSRVPIFQQAEKEQVLTEMPVDCGEKWQELSMRYDHDSSGWRTVHCLFQEDLEESSATFPKWGLMRDGVCWEQIMSQHPTTAKEFGSMRNQQRPGSEKKMDGPVESVDLESLKDAGVIMENGYVKSAESGHTHSVMTNGTVANGVAPKIWLTVMTNEDAAGTPKGKMQKMLGNHPLIRGVCKDHWNSGTLNPTWAEWLMGFPTGWTDLEA